MIKNILYSICFHLTLLIAIYFGLQKIHYPLLEDHPEEISISVMDNIENSTTKKKSKNNIAPKVNLNKREVKKIAVPEKKYTPPPLSPSPKKEIKKVKTAPPLPAKKEEVKIAPEIKEISIKEIYQDSQTEDIDDLDLSAIRRRSMKNHLNFCFSGILNDQSEDLERVEKIEVIFHMTKNGVIKFDYEENTKTELLKGEKFTNYKKIIEKIDNAAKKCAIFRNLPQEKHGTWKEFKVLFKP